MTANTFRGNAIQIAPKTLSWVYADDGALVSETWKTKPCGHCGKTQTSEGHDGCLGTLPGVSNACCGHGVTADSYVQFDKGNHLVGGEALAFFAAQKVTK